VLLQRRLQGAKLLCVDAGLLFNREERVLVTAGVAALMLCDGRVEVAWPS
jgi:hypothetical protein